MEHGPEHTKKMGCIKCSNEFGGDLTLCPHDGTRLTPLNEGDLVGTVLDNRYEIQEVLGGGGMGQVYKAKHRLMNRTVAIKVLHKHMISNPEALERFRLESEAVSRLNLPNILTVYDFGISNQGQPFMVMDYLAGVSLQDLLEQEGHLDVIRSLNIFLQIALALKHAHDKSIIHRDLKPSNIMLIDFGGQSDFVKIVDFGISKLIGRMEGHQLTRTGEVFGSPLFMSPEQCRGLPLDPRTDIYSLGSVMYLTLTGKPLFEGENVLDIFFKQSTQQPEPFSVVCPELAIPPEVEAVVFKALEKEASERFQSMAALRTSLETVKAKLLGTGGTDLTSSPALATQGNSTLTKSETSQKITGSTESGAQQPAGEQEVEASASTIQVPSPRTGRLRTALLAACALALISSFVFSFELGRNERIEEEDKQIGTSGQSLLENGAPVIIKQSLRPSEPLVAPGQNVDVPKSTSLETERPGPSTLPREARLAEGNKAAERNRARAPISHHRTRYASTSHHSILGKAIHLFKKAL